MIIDRKNGTSVVYDRIRIITTTGDIVTVTVMCNAFLPSVIL